MSNQGKTPIRDFTSGPLSEIGIAMASNRADISITAFPDKTLGVYVQYTGNPSSSTTVAFGIESYGECCGYIRQVITAVKSKNDMKEQVA